MERAAAYKKMVEYYHGSTLDITFVCGDWLSRDIEAQIDHEYDLIFNFGVIEHYLTEEERINFLHKKLGFLRSGGYLVSYVPSGIHPFRFLQVQNGWGGYVVPETNYNAGQIRKEGELSGATDIVVLPHNYFGYLTMIPSSGFRRFLHRGTFLVAQLFPSKLMRLLPDKYAKEFLLIARKP